MRRLAIFVATMFACTSVAPEVQAAMGLKCSDWLNARAHTRYDEVTKRFVAVNPVGAPPVTADVDTKSAELNFYVGGIVETLNQLDAWLTKAAEAPGIQIPPRADLRATLDRVAQLCRGSLQNDVLDLVNLNNQGSVLLRVKAMQEITEKYMETGQRYRRRVPQ